MKNKALDEALKAVKATPEYKDWKKADNACLEALGAMYDTPEYKDWLEADMAKEKALKAYYEARKTQENSADAYWKANNALWKADEAWKALEATPESKDWEEERTNNAHRAAIKALESTPEYKDYIKAGGTCRELRRN